MRTLLPAQVGRFADFVLRGRDNPALLEPEICFDLFVFSPFENLAIKSVMVVTNYLDRNEIKYDTGPLRPAEPGSMAIPGLFRPVAFRDKVLIDGGAVNPFAYDLLFGLADVIVAVDVRLLSDELHRRLR
jgi:NTE family protein